MFITLLLLWSLLLSLLYFFFTTIQKHQTRLTKPLLNSTYGLSSYPIIGCFIYFYKNQHNLLDRYTSLLSGSPSQTIVAHRLGARRTVVTGNPSNVEHILKTNFANFPKGKPLTKFLEDLLGCGIFNVDGDLWSTQHKLASHEFSIKSLGEFVVNTLEEEVEHRLMLLLKEATKSQRVLDMQEILRRFAFDTVSKVSLGSNPFCLDLTRPVPPIVKAFECAAEISANRGTTPLYLMWKMKRALSIGFEKKLKEAVKVIHGPVHGTKFRYYLDFNFFYTKKIVDSDESSHDLALLVAQQASLHNPQDRDRSRIRRLIKKWYGKLGFDDLQKMRFLRACLCESMRLYPPVPWDPKHAEVDIVLLDVTWVGKGDRVTYFPYGIRRMKELWGKGPFKFNPDWWFDIELGFEIGESVQISSFSGRPEGLPWEGDGFYSYEVCDGFGVKAV